MLAATATLAVAAAARWTFVESVAPTPPTTRVVAVPVDYYRVNPNNDRELQLSLMLGLGDEVVDSSATETSDRVVVRVNVRQDLRAKAALGVPASATVVLRDPLGARTVVDVSGRRVRPQP